MLSPSGIPRSTLAAHAALTVLIPYLHSRLRSHALSHAWPDTPSADRRRKAWNLLSRVESTHALAALASFIVFLCNGRYRSLADRVLSMRMVPSRRLTNREVSYEFMNRQMVWHSFTVSSSSLGISCVYDIEPSGRSLPRNSCFLSFRSSMLVQYDEISTVLTCASEV